MTAYYNEHDPYAAKWLRNLIAAGVIAPGEVDERDIRDIVPTDLAGFDQCHFFAGIGGWSAALRLAGVPDDFPIWTGSCPCQPFSAAGKGIGFADERHLWPAWFHLVRVCRPVRIVGEQVASDDALHWFDLVRDDLQDAGYAVGSADLCAAGIGAPQIRQRLWFVAKPAGERGGKRYDLDLFGRWERDAEQVGLGGQPARLASERVGLADADGERCRAARGRGAELQDVEQCGGDGRLADTAICGSGAGFCSCGQGGGGRLQSSNTGCDGELGFAFQSRLEGLAGNGDGAARRALAAGPVAEAGDVGGLGDAVHSGNRAGPENTCGPSPLHGFWRNADWLFCRDGKWRPVEPGTFPLVDGLPVDMGLVRAGQTRFREEGKAPWRIGMLRGYGNAIVPRVAETFLRSAL